MSKSEKLVNSASALSVETPTVIYKPTIPTAHCASALSVETPTVIYKPTIPTTGRSNKKLELVRNHEGMLVSAELVENREDSSSEVVTEIYEGSKRSRAAERREDEVLVDISNPLFAAPATPERSPATKDPTFSHEGTSRKFVDILAQKAKAAALSASILI